MSCKHATFQAVPLLKTMAETYVEKEKKEQALKNSRIKHDMEVDRVDGNPEKIGNVNGLAKSAVRCTSETVFAEMKNEASRLESYKGWPVPGVQPSDLASAGLFYLGAEDRVQCAFCRGIITEWREGDDPLREHICHFPMCPLLLGRDVGNVPIKSTDECGRGQAFREDCSLGCTSSDTVRVGPKFPDFNSVDKRLQTYKKWSPYHVCRPEDLAECGLFYTDIADLVTCFCCGGTLGHWERGDDPWVEHAKHFPQCSFLRYIKGSTFVQNVHSPAQSQNSPPENNAPAANPQTSALSSVPLSNMLAQVSLKENEKSGSDASPTASGEERTYMCKICMEDKPRVAFIPCGHSLTCPDCATKLSTCPVCRRVILSTMRLYID